MPELHPHAFLEPASLPLLSQEHHAVLNDTNAKLTRILDALVPKTAEVQGSAHLTSQGKVERLRSLAEQADRDSRAVLKQKQAALDSWLSESERAIEDALSPAQPERVHGFREDVRLLVASQPSPSHFPQLMTNTEGQVLVGQGAISDILLTTASQGALEASKLTVAAVRRASPILQELVGGKQVIDSMVQRLSARVAKPALARKASLERLQTVMDSNGASAHKRILALTGLSAVRTEDAIQESATTA